MDVADLSRRSWCVQVATMASRYVFAHCFSGGDRKFERFLISMRCVLLVRVCTVSYELSAFIISNY